MKYWLSCLLISSTNAFWNTGHLLVARIGYEVLLKDSPQTIDQVENLLSVLKQSDPTNTTSENYHPMVECATFADEIKLKNGKYQENWHFIDQPYLDQGGKISDFNFTFDTHNVTAIMHDMIDFINHNDGYNQSFTYSQIMAHQEPGATEEDGLSTAMRFIIHYTGDIHQPLHAVARVDHKYPSGDMGGNLFPLPKKEGVMNLHSLWDSVIYEFADDAQLPFTDSTWTANGFNATELMKKYPVSDADATNIDITAWTQDSLKIAEDFLYKRISEDQTVPAEYVKEATDIIGRQIVLGGHRLANFIKSLKLDKFSPIEKFLL